MAFAFSWLAEIPLPYLITAAAVLFAVVMTGLLRFAEWRAKARPGRSAIVIRYIP